MYEEIDNLCNDMGCSRNDWIKEILKEKLVQEVKQESQGLKEPLESIVPRIIVEDVDETVKYEDGTPRPTVEIIYD